MIPKGLTRPLSGCGHSRKALPGLPPRDQTRRMVFLGFHASHEQLPPSRLLAAVTRAESAGFDGAMCSDHLAPWGVRQGESGYAWSWLGAALASTSFSLGLVTAPGQRYHPVITAQAIATLEEMFPGRFWAALGSGEAVNEHVTGDPWPPKEDRRTESRRWTRSSTPSVSRWSAHFRSYAPRPRLPWSNPAQSGEPPFLPL